MPDTILEEDHPRIFQQSLVEIGSVVSEEKIFLKFHPPFFLICIIGQNRQKFKVHKKSRNICLKAHHYALTVQIWAHFQVPLSGLYIQVWLYYTDMREEWDTRGNNLAATGKV